MGAWIETYSAVKLISWLLIVAPLMGAWIETTPGLPGPQPLS